MNYPRGTSLIGKSVRDFSEKKDLYGFLMEFSRKQKDFCQRCTRFLGVKRPSESSFYRYAKNASMTYGMSKCYSMKDITY